MLLIHTIIQIIKPSKNVLGCGIVAYSGENNFDKDKLKILFLYNESRGEQAAGLYTNNESYEFGNNRVIRKIGKASKKIVPYFNFEPTNLSIGHTRKSSLGMGKGIHCVHPFIFDNVVGVHNGTFTNHKEVVNGFQLDEKEYEVDSQIFYKVLEDLYSENKNKIDSFQEAIGYFEGGAALVASFKDDPETLFIYRNKEKPLFRGTINDAEGNKGVYLSSLKEGLEAIDCTNIKEIREGVIYTISRGEVVCTHKKPLSKELPIVVEEVNLNDFELLSSTNPKIVKEVKIPTDQFSYINQYHFEDGSIGIGSTYSNLHKEIKTSGVIFCNTRKAYFARLYYGAYKEESYFFEIPIPSNLFMQSNISNLIAPEYEGTANLIYDMYGQLATLLIDIIEAKEKNDLSLINQDLLQNELFKMESFLSILTD